MGSAYLELSFPWPTVVVVVVPLAACPARVPGSRCVPCAGLPMPVGQRDLLDGAREGAAVQPLIAGASILAGAGATGLTLGGDGAGPGVGQVEGDALIEAPAEPPVVV